MKTKVLILSLVIALLLSFSVSAEGVSFGISVPEGFIESTADNNVEAAAEKLNLEAYDLKECFNNDGLIYLAVSQDAKTQVKLLCFNFNNAFSSKVDDISSLDQEGLDSFVKAVAGNNEFEIAENNGRKFVKIKNTLTDSGGDYTVTQYVTIANNMTYYLVCYNDGLDTANEVVEIFESFTLEFQNTQPENSNNNLKMVIAIVSAGGCLAVCVLMVIGIVNTKSKYREETFENEE